MAIFISDYIQILKSNFKNLESKLKNYQFKK